MQAYFLWRAYVLIGRKKWILILVVPQLYVLCYNIKRASR